MNLSSLAEIHTLRFNAEIKYQLKTCYAKDNNVTNLMSINTCVTTREMTPPHAMSANGLIRGSSSLAKPGTT